ncbi:MAG TPA: hypothetical protein ENG81_05805 [Candidatus Bathyarchaeota archaeon]|nr:hypothetical protein [Candidatus Bathyarchaeota archaeon]
MVSIKEIDKIYEEAYNSLFNAWEALRKMRVDQCLQDAVETIKKCIHIYEKIFLERYGIRDPMKNLEKILNFIGGIRRLEKRRIIRAYIIKSIWLNGNVEKTIKYGRLGMEPNIIFKEMEARMAVEHASEIYQYISSLIHGLKSKVKDESTRLTATGGADEEFWENYPSTAGEDYGKQPI